MAAPRTILLVEDNPADVYLIRQALAEYGHDIQLAVVSDGGEALAFLRKEPPFTDASTPVLILLDFTLPRISGVKVLTELRRMAAYHATPIVVFSSAGKDIAGPLCLHSGASAYVQKPFGLDAFFAAIRAIVSQWLKPDGGH